MERAVEERFERIETLLRATAERGEKADIRFNQFAEKADQRHEQAMRRMDRMDKKWDKKHTEAMQRMDRAGQRMEIFDRKLDATRKLVEAGMKMVMSLGRRQKALDESIRELNKSQKAFLDSFRKGGNGHGKLS